FFAAGFVENEVAGDGEKVGREFGFGPVAFRVTPDAEEHLLGDVLGFRRIAQHLRDRADDGALVSLDEFAESAVIARADALHQEDVACIFIGGRWIAICLHDGEEWTSGESGAGHGFKTTGLEGSCADFIRMEKKKARAGEARAWGSGRCRSG